MGEFKCSCICTKKVLYVKFSGKFKYLKSTDTDDFSLTRFFRNGSITNSCIKYESWMFIKFIFILSK